MEIKKKFEKGSLGYYRELAKKDGFEGPDALTNWNKWRAENGKLPRWKKPDNIIYNNPYKSYEELNKLAIERGFSDLQEYVNKELGTPNKSINKYLEQYFGIHIAERYVSSLFEDIIRMPINNLGYDWICKKGYKIQHKGSCIIYDDKGWSGFAYKIKYNDIADYFILTGWNNRSDLKPLFLLLIGNEEIIRGKPFWMRKTFYLTNKPEYMKEFEQYNQLEKLEILKIVCKREMTL